MFRTRVMDFPLHGGRILTPVLGSVFVCFFVRPVLVFLSRGRGHDGLHDMVIPCSIGSVAKVGTHVCVKAGDMIGASTSQCQPFSFFLGVTGEQVHNHILMGAAVSLTLSVPRSSYRELPTAPELSCSDISLIANSATTAFSLLSSRVEHAQTSFRRVLCM